MYTKEIFLGEIIIGNMLLLKGPPGIHSSMSGGCPSSTHMLYPTGGVHLLSTGWCLFHLRCQFLRAVT